MNFLGKRISRSNGLSLLLLLLSALTSSAKDLAPLVAPPVIVAAQPDDWVSATTASFRNVLLGKIYYTLDGSNPTSKSTAYNEGSEIRIDHSLTLKGVHIQSNIASTVVSQVFTRAQVAAVTAKYGGKTGFYPSVLCSLQVAARAGTGSGAAPTIRYTLNGAVPSLANSTVYTTPIKIQKSETVRAYAVQNGYDDSDPIQVVFTLLEPPAVPVASPKGQNFSTGTLKIKLTSATAGTYFRYTVDTALKNMDTARIVEGDSVSILGGKIADTTYFRFIACKTGYPSSAVAMEKYVYLPQLASPVFSKPSGYFYDTALIYITGPKNADVRYTMNGSSPTLASFDGSGPIQLNTSATFKAKAFHAPQPESNDVTATYTLLLTPPVFDKQSQEFTNSLEVQIASRCPGAFIYYTLDGNQPTLTTGIPLSPTGKVTLSSDGTTILKAFAYKDGISSLVDSAVFTKQAVILKLAAPIIEPTARRFTDTLGITMRTDDANAEIRYTTDGTDPVKESPKYAGTPIRLDSSATLRARAFPVSGPLSASLVREEKYILTPSPPLATPAADAPFANSVLVTLKTNTKNGSILYNLGDTPLTEATATLYQAGHPLLFSSTTRLKAMTKLTNDSTRYSTLLDATYEIYTGNSSDSLAPGSSRTLTGGLVFTNASDAPITAKAHAPDGFTLNGFKNVSLAVLLQPAQAGGSFKATFTKFADKTTGLYRYTDGNIEFITSDSRYDLTVPGEYFVGTDTLPPVLVLRSQESKADGATVIELSVEDNVANPTCELQSSGLTGGKAAFKPDSNRRVFASLKLAEGDLKGLWFRAGSADAFNTGHLPKDPAGKFFLKQAWDNLNTLAVLSLGRANSAWDLAGFPNGPAMALTWEQVRTANAAGNLEGAIWSEAIQNYTYLEDNSVILPGMAFWIGSRTPITSLALSGFQSANSESDGTFRMALHPGWNQVTSPSLDRVYWPVTTAASKVPTTYLKAPYRYIPDKDDFAQTDSLEPWKGYFVHYFGGSDTTITLYGDPGQRAAARPAPKWAAGAADEPAPGTRLILDFGRSMPLTLAARQDGQDGAGAEDEPALPSLTPHFTAWSQRGNRHLLTDVVRFNPGQVQHWNIVLADSGRASRGASASARLRLLESAMPAGYEAWAISSVRHLKFALKAGMDVPLSDMAGDTLSVYAGPLDKLSAISEFAGAALSVQAMAFNLEKTRGGRGLKLALPTAENVAIEILSPLGRRLASAYPGRLGPGIYHLDLSPAHSSGIENTQIAFLRIRLQGAGGFRDYAQKVLW